MKYSVFVALSSLFASAIARPKRLNRRASLSLEDSDDGIANSLTDDRSVSATPLAFDYNDSYSNDPQKSHTLLESVIAYGFQNDGQSTPIPGQTPSLTSPNNFINFCATVPHLPLGHSHVVIEALPALDSTALTDPSKFAFFKGLNAKAEQGVLTAEVAGGLPKGAYRLASIHTAANHQPLLVATAQCGALDDVIYFTVA